MAQSDSPLRQMKRLGLYRPGIEFGFRSPLKNDSGFIGVLPLKKLWPAKFFVSIFLISFSMPLFLMDFGMGEVDDLFDFTASLFSIFWAMSWSTGLAILALILVTMLFAREVLVVEPDNIRLRIELFNLGIESSNPLKYISDLRYVEKPIEKGSIWRGKHLAFDYLHIPISFSSQISPSRAKELLRRIQHTLEHPVPASLPPEMDQTLASQGSPEQNVASMISEPVETVSSPDDNPGSRASLYLLVAANLIPAVGVILAGWDVGDIMLLFWLESAIIALFNILKMLRISGPLAIFYSIFFVGHFGAFMAVHLMFIFGLFIEKEGVSASIPEVLVIFKSMWIAITALLISHGFSFKQNFIDKQEYLQLTIKDQMHKPYNRIMIMHVTLIIGGFLVLALDSRLLALMLLIALKVIVDMKSHIRKHE